MADNYSWDVVVRFATQGARAAGANMEDFEKHVDNATRAVVNHEKARNRVFERQDRIYTNYLEKQEAAYTKQDRIYNDYLSGQEAGAKRQAQVLEGELTQATQRYSSALGGRISQERALTRETKRRDNKAAAQAWDEEFKALSRTTAAAGQLNSNLPRLRYALYDVSRTALTASAAITGVGVALTVASASYESAFTAVERTSGVMGEGAERLRGQLMQLTREIPQSFGEIANLAARGAQLGIATDAISDFTEVVAQFVATSDTVTLDQAVEAFGRISNLMGDTDFNRIGSAITLVGVNAAATEAQIIKTTQELAPFATAVGLSTEEVIALAAAMGSLGQPPERARSAFLTLQRVMDNAIAYGSDNLRSFAELLNLTVDETSQLWDQDPGAFIEAFARSLGSVENLTVAFADLGINERRAVQVFQALAADSRNAGDGLSVLERAFEDANQGYEEGTELARQYALILDDLNSKWQIFVNAVGELAQALGNTLAPVAKGLLDIITSIVQSLAEFAQSPFGATLVIITGAVLGLVAALAGLVGVSALGLASVAGLKTAMTELNIQTGVSIFSLSGLRSALGSVSATMGISTAAVNGFKVALATTGIGLAVVALGTLATAFLNAGLSAEQAFDKFVGSSAGLADALEQDSKDRLEAIVTLNHEVARSFERITPSMQKFAIENDEAATAISNTATVLGLIPKGMERANQAISDSTMYLGENTRAWITNQLMQSEAFQNLAGNADFVEHWQAIGADFQEVVTLSATQGEAAVLDYFYRLELAYEEGQRRLGVAITTTQGAFDSTGSLQSGWAGGGRTMFGTALGRDYNDFIKTMSGISGQLAIVGQTGKRSGRAIVESYGDADDTMEDFNGTVGETGKEIRTLVDYARDLQSVFSRAFDLRFSSGSTLDKITSTFLDLQKAAEESARTIRSLQADIRGIEAEISQQEYFLGIAIQYGDFRRAEQIQANLAGLNADLEGKTADLTAEQAKNSREVKGNTEEAIRNRETLRGLVEQYQDHLVALANSGLGQEELEQRSKELRDEFIRQATQLGYNEQDIKDYSAAFQDMSTIISEVPRNVTIEANANPAITALKEYEEALNSARSNSQRGISAPKITNPNSAKEIRRLALESQILARDGYIKELVRGGNYSGATRAAEDLAVLRRMLQTGSYADGGFTGRGGRLEPAGIVHKGEYVIPKHMVNQSTGLPYADAMGKLQRGASGPGYANGGFVRGNSSLNAPGHIASFGPMAEQQLQHALRQIVTLDGKTISNSSAQQYAEQTTLGAF